MYILRSKYVFYHGQGLAANENARKQWGYMACSTVCRELFVESLVLAIVRRVLAPSNIVSLSSAIFPCHTQ